MAGSSGTASVGEKATTFLVEMVRDRSVAELTAAALIAAGLPAYGRKASAKRAAERTIERVLGYPDAFDGGNT